MRVGTADDCGAVEKAVREPADCRPLSAREDLCALGAGGVDDRAISISPVAAGLITITDNLISGTSQGQFGTASWGRGIWFDGGGVALTVHDNLIEWARSGLNLDMSGSSTANVSDNSFHGLGTSVAVGVDNDGVTLSNNDYNRVGDDFNFRNRGEGEVRGIELEGQFALPLALRLEVALASARGEDRSTGEALDSIAARGGWLTLRWSRERARVLQPRRPRLVRADVRKPDAGSGTRLAGDRL